MLGVYVVLFFIAVQMINWLFFHVVPERLILLGGTLIISGGLLMTFWR